MKSLKQFLVNECDQESYRYYNRNSITHGSLKKADLKCKKERLQKS